MPGNGMSAKCAHRGCCAPSQPTRYAARSPGTAGLRPAHVRGHRGVVLAQPDQLVSSTDLGAELEGDLASRRSSSGCGHDQQLHRGIGRTVKSTCTPPNGSCSGGWRLRPASNRSSSPVVAQHVEDLPVETARLGDVSDLGSFARTPATRTPAMRSSTASIRPVGPAPTMITSAVIAHFPAFVVSRIRDPRSPVVLTSNRPFCPTVPG